MTTEYIDEPLLTDFGVVMIDQVRKMAGVIKALGDPTRLRIIRMLASNPEDTLCVADLAARLGSTQPAASQHIKVLKNVGILEANKVGFRVYYRINTNVFLAYKADMDDLFEMAFAHCPRMGACEEHKD
ncbi:MAG: metalloregulator ArsR/SmtB family transcription factor [Ardenticatenales bacterium]|nr:metalloregulator ArsR/SmtB family transcription factor [Ardenticatenales bacterium]